MACRCLCTLRQIPQLQANHMVEAVTYGFLKSSPSCLVFVRDAHRNHFSSKFGKKLQENASRNPRNIDEVEKYGMSEFLKKNRMFAQYNYQEWRYPRKERAIDISCTRVLLNDYDGKKESLTTRLRQPQKEFLEKKNELLSHRLIKKRIPTFHRKRFPAEAQEIYLKAHELLNTENWTLSKKDETEEQLHGLVTEYVYDDMLKGLDIKTVNWKYIESIEPPQVVQIGVLPMIHQDNLYGQVTVRFHTKQLLSIHDRFGRLMVGSPDKPRDVLEFVTFERHIVEPYGKWRIHAKKLAESVPQPQSNTYAVVKRKPARAEADEWHKKEEEECSYKWYPTREFVKKAIARVSKQRRGVSFWRRRRKFIVNHVMRTPKTRMSKKDMQRLSRKRSEVYELRQRGELPMPTD